MSETVTTVTSETELPAKPKTKRLKVFLIALGVFALAGAVTVTALLYKESRAIDRYFEAGNKSYDKAFNELEAALPEVAKVGIGGPKSTDIEKQSNKILMRIPRAQKQLGKARRHFALMRKTAFSETERKIASLSDQSVVQAEKGANELASKIEQLGTTSEILEKVRGASDRFNAGFAKNNEAINAVNDDKFDEASQKANEAGKLFAQARSLLAQANETVLDQSLAAAAAKIGRAQRWVAGTREMIKAGQEKEMEVYNGRAQENNRLSEEVTDVAVDPILSHPDKWMRDKLEVQNDRIESAFLRADKFRDRALELWKKNT